MAAAELFQRLRALGVILSIESGGRLAYDAPGDVIDDGLLDEMRSHRDELLSVVELFEERAAIIEFEGGLSRAQAEAKAMAELRSMDVPKVLNRRCDVIPSDAVYIGRPSRWGNPFKVEQFDTREECLAAYRKWLVRQPELLSAIRQELRGKDLVCWCKPLSCHGDVLLEVANDV